MGHLPQRAFLLVLSSSAETLFGYLLKLLWPAACCRHVKQLVTSGKLPSMYHIPRQCQACSWWTTAPGGILGHLQQVFCFCFLVASGKSVHDYGQYPGVQGSSPVSDFQKPTGWSIDQGTCEDCSSPASLTSIQQILWFSPPPETKLCCNPVDHSPPLWRG